MRIGAPPAILRNRESCVSLSMGYLFFYRCAGTLIVRRARARIWRDRDFRRKADDSERAVLSPFQLIALLSANLRSFGEKWRKEEKDELKEREVKRKREEMARKRRRTRHVARIVSSPSWHLNERRIFSTDKASYVLSRVNDKPLWPFIEMGTIFRSLLFLPTSSASSSKCHQISSIFFNNLSIDNLIEFIVDNSRSLSAYMPQIENMSILAADCSKKQTFLHLQAKHVAGSFPCLRFREIYHQMIRKIWLNECSVLTFMSRFSFPNYARYEAYNSCWLPPRFSNILDMF